MAVDHTHREVEIKLRVVDAAHGCELARRAGCRLLRERTFESNTLFDTADHALRQRGELLRVREFGGDCLLTYKGSALPGKHKVREEIEVRVSNFTTMSLILARLGLDPAFRYEKYRTEYESAGGQGLVTVDETPIGVYIEIEGPPDWIDATAAAMGASVSDYITASYGRLYLEFCAKVQRAPADMTFDGGKG